MSFRNGVSDTERARDDLVRRLPCPKCEAPPTHGCHYAWTSAGGKTVKMSTSHEARYVQAAEAGLVPPLVAR